MTHFAAWATRDDRKNKKSRREYPNEGSLSWQIQNLTRAVSPNIYLDGWMPSLSPRTPKVTTWRPLLGSQLLLVQTGHRTERSHVACPDHVPCDPREKAVGFVREWCQSRDGVAPEQQQAKEFAIKASVFQI